MNKMSRTKDLKYSLLCVLMLFMPFQYYVCTLFLKGTQIDNLFRDFIIVLLLLLTCKRRIRLDKISVLIIINIIGLIFSAITTLVFRTNSEEFERLRLYLMPMLIYFITANIRISKDKYDKLNKYQCVLFSVIAVYGVFQAFVLGQSFLIKLGYRSTASGMYLDGSAFYITGLFGLQRAVALFNSPNLAGALFAMFICVLICADNNKSRSFFFILGSISIGLIATFSRSSIIGLALALILVASKNRGLHLNAKTIGKILGVIVLIIIMLVIVDSFISKGIFSQMFNHILKMTVSGADRSMQKHITDLYEPLEIVFQNPFGRGFGDNGPIALQTSSSTALNVESSFYLMIYEEGLLFGVLFFIPYIVTIIDGIKHRRKKSVATACICIICMFQYLVLPTVQTYEMIFYSYAYMGFYYNKYIQQSFNQSNHITRVVGIQGE